MGIFTESELIQAINDFIPDNNTEDISASDIRNQLIDIVQSAVLVKDEAESAIGNIKFDVKAGKLYGFSSVVTGNLSEDLTGAKLGAWALIKHNDAIEPVLPSGWDKLPGYSYILSADNYLFARYISHSAGTRVVVLTIASNPFQHEDDAAVRTSLSVIKDGPNIKFLSTATPGLRQAIWVQKLYRNNSGDIDMGVSPGDYADAIIQMDQTVDANVIMPDKDDVENGFTVMIYSLGGSAVHKIQSFGTSFATGESQVTEPILVISGGFEFVLDIPGKFYKFILVKYTPSVALWQIVPGQTGLTTPIGIRPSLASVPTLLRSLLQTRDIEFIEVVDNIFDLTIRRGWITLTDQATITWQTNYLSLGSPNAKVILAGNRTLSEPNNVRDMEKLKLQLIQDVTGSRTIIWPAKFKFVGGISILSTAANAIDLLEAVYDETDDIYLCRLTLNYS